MEELNQDGSAKGLPDASRQKKGTGPWDLPVWAGLVKSETWTQDCQSFYGKVLEGDWIHWCDEWDGLPIDETCDEFNYCKCFPDTPHPLPAEGPRPKGAEQERME